MSDAFIVVGNAGYTHTLTVVDENEDVYNISEADSLEIIFVDPSGNEVAVPASLKTDGTDGKMEYEVTGQEASGVDDEAGVWKRYGKVTMPGSEPVFTSVDRYRVKSPGEV